MISQFRNFSYREFEFESSKLAYIQGQNGSGKSSILEAINYLSSGKSYRTHKDSECIKWECSSFMIRGTFSPYHNDHSTNLSLYYGSDKKHSRRKVAKVDNEMLSKLSHLQSYLTTVTFSPQNIRLLQDGPSMRRQFIDELISIFEKDYLQVIKNYRQSRKQKNEVLKMESPDPLLLDQYDEKLAKNGKIILKKRRNMLDLIEDFFIQKLQDFHSESFVEPSLKYQSDLSKETSLEDVISNSRKQDIRRGFTTRGPHRDDWMIKLRGRSVDEFASRGELRVLLLALKLAEASLIIEKSNKVPIMLLDDVESELDKRHQNQLLAYCEDKTFQTVITGTGELISTGDFDEEKIINLS